MDGFRVVVAAALLAGCGREGFDASHDAAVGDAAIDAPPPANIAFVSSTTQLPQTFNSDLSGADAVCMARAQAAGLAGTFVAFLSTSTINARDRLAGSRGWVRVDGKPVLDSNDDIASGKIYYPIVLDENGSYVDQVRVVTGTLGTGNGPGGCSDYTTTGTVGVGLASSTSFDWLDHAGNSVQCNSAQRIYCFGLGIDRPLVVQPEVGRHAFVTVSNYVVDAGGIATADALCNTEAQAAGISGSFLAVLATSTKSALSRFNYLGTGLTTWVRLDGIPVSTTPLAFAAGAIVAPINLTSARTYIASTLVTTGAGSLSTPSNLATDDCADWTTPTGTADTGLANDIVEYFTGTGIAAHCTDSPIYCFEQ